MITRNYGLNIIDTLKIVQDYFYLKGSYLEQAYMLCRSIPLHFGQSYTLSDLLQKALPKKTRGELLMQKFL